jgi:hypothetical protein
MSARRCTSSAQTVRERLQNFGRFQNFEILNDSCRCGWPCMNVEKRVSWRSAILAITEMRIFKNSENRRKIN